MLKYSRENIILGKWRGKGFKLDFAIVGNIESVSTIAEGNGIRELARLRKVYGSGNWKKKKGFAIIRLGTGETCRAEIHWYEAHGIGKLEHKIKRFL